MKGQGGFRESRVPGEACLGFGPVSETDRKKDKDRKEDRTAMWETLQAAGFLLLWGQARGKDTVFSH